MKTYRNAERTRQWIRRAFTELIAEKKDIEKISVAELARRADISKTTFYYHYEDIYAVAEEFENELIEAIRAALSDLGRNAPATPLEMETYGRRIIAVLKQNDESYRMVMGASSPRLFVEKLKRLLANMITENAAALPLSPDPARRGVQVCFLSSACVDTIVEYFRGSLDADLDTVTEIILEAIRKLSTGQDG